MSKMSNSYKNFSIKTKVITLVVIMLIFNLILGIFGFFSLHSVTSEYELLLGTASEQLNLSSNLQFEVSEFQNVLGNVIVQSEVYDDDSATNEALNELEKAWAEVHAITDKYKAVVDADDALTKEAQQNLYNLRQKFLDTFDPIEDMFPSFKTACENDDTETVDKVFNDVSAIIEQSYTNIAAIRQAAIDRRDVLDDSASTTANMTEVLLIIIFVLGFIVSLVVSLIITGQIVKPIIKVTEVSKAAANGNFSQNSRTNLTNEIGQLTNNISMFIDTVKEIMEDMMTAFDAMNDGRVDEAKVNSSKYQGEYRVMAENINKVLLEVGNEFDLVCSGINEYAEGNFDYESPRFKNQKAIVHESLDKMKSHIKEISSSIGTITKNINNGDLDINIPSEGLKGDWKILIDDLNILVENVSAPIRETKSALKELANGNFKFSIETGKFKGEFREMAENINYTVNVLSEYINEISNILKNMANQNLDVEITHKYIGDFKEIQDSLNLIISNFNQLIKEIIMSSEQVAIGSQSIADSSTALAQGASEQASAVEELTATIGLVSKSAEKNTENVIKSNELADTAKESATHVRDEMQELLKAMDAINESSNNISNIIKVIDDIAFQTNILALNAAVEAARAGEHGKGFAVVADEVRSLAARSQTSAQETSTLIAESLEKAEQGSDIVNRTADTVRKIVNQIDEISALSVEIANDSKEQTNSISEINIGINQIATVVSNNTATSEESAAASEELASQSAVFKQTVSKFSLKNQGYTQ